MVRGAVFRYTLALESAGFLLITVIIWLDEILDLPRLLFGAAPTPLRLGEGLLESVLTLAIGTAVVSITYRAFRRIESRIARGSVRLVSPGSGRRRMAGNGAVSGTSAQCPHHA